MDFEEYLTNILSKIRDAAIESEYMLQILDGTLSEKRKNHFVVCTENGVTIGDTMDTQGRLLESIREISDQLADGILRGRGSVNSMQEIKKNCNCIDCIIKEDDEISYNEGMLWAHNSKKKVEADD